MVAFPCTDVGRSEETKVNIDRDAAGDERKGDKDGARSGNERTRNTRMRGLEFMPISFLDKLKGITCTALHPLATGG